MPRARERDRDRADHMQRAAAGGGGGGGDTLLADLTTAAGEAPTSLFVVETDAQKWSPVATRTVLSAVNNIGGYDDVAVSIVVDDGSAFRVGDLFQPEGSSEVLAVTGISANTLTVTRGYKGTTAGSISDNARLCLVSNPVAADTERVFQLVDQVGMRVYMREGVANKGGLLAAASIGTRAAIVMDDASSEFFEAVRQLNEYGWYGDGSAHTFAMLCQLDAPVLNNSSVYINDGVVGHSAGDSTRPYMTHRDMATDVLYQVAGASGSSGGLASAQIQSAPRVLYGRHDGTLGYAAAIDKTLEARSGAGSGSTPLLKRLRLFRHLTYQGGKFAVFATWAKDLSDAELYDVTDVLRAWAGLDPVADP